MNRIAKICLAAIAAFTLFSVPVFAASSAGVPPGAGTATLGLMPESASVMMMLSSTLFGSFYLLSRRRR